MQRILVTAGLPYANGRAHIGHLVEYCLTDIYVRALKHLGRDAHYICASDAHGTPIEINASNQGISPEALVQESHEAYKKDFARFDVAFDHYGITHSDANREIVQRVYDSLRSNGELEDRVVEGNFCETDARFLPDRFIKGTCPRCGTCEQYGDVCEACGATYSATDLKDPHCVLCNNPPIRKKSEHVFFRLSSAKNVQFLTDWLESGVLKSDVANYVRQWITCGLRDWCISRDGPYFGFEIPDKPGKFFYVWLDAPLGYVSSSKEWGDANQLSLEQLWQSSETRIEHVIGKDIVYFHTLFWPAVLSSVGFSLPSRVHVHGMLTVNGEKMSKSRGTFIKASVFADHIEPQALRYYYACKLGPNADDIDLSFDDFVCKINGELVNKHANLISRTSQFLLRKLDGSLGDLPFEANAALEAPTDNASMLDLARKVVAACKRIEDLYQTCEFGQVMRELGIIADIGNEFFQARTPWADLKTNPDRARETCTFAANVCHALLMYLWPVVPRFAETGARILGCSIDRMDTTLLFQERSRPIHPFERLFDRIDQKAIEAMVKASKEDLQCKQTTPKTSSDNKASKQEASMDQFQALDLRVGIVREASRIPKSKKLLKLSVDLGEDQARQIVAGIAHMYEPTAITGTHVVVISNLKPTKLMGVESRGMVLAANAGDQLALVRPDKDLLPGTRVS